MENINSNSTVEDFFNGVIDTLNEIPDSSDCTSSDSTSASIADSVISSESKCIHSECHLGCGENDSPDVPFAMKSGVVEFPVLSDAVTWQPPSVPVQAQPYQNPPFTNQFGQEQSECYGQVHHQIQQNQVQPIHLVQNQPFQTHLIQYVRQNEEEPFPPNPSELWPCCAFLCCTIFGLIACGQYADIKKAKGKC